MRKLLSIITIILLQIHIGFANEKATLSKKDKLKIDSLNELSFKTRVNNKTISINAARLAIKDSVLVDYEDGLYKGYLNLGINLHFYLPPQLISLKSHTNDRSTCGR